MHSMKKFGLFLLASAVALSALGCASSGGDQDTTLPPETTVPKVTVEYHEVTDPGIHVPVTLPPVTKPPVSLGVPAQTAQIRIQSGSSAWQNAFKQETGCFAVVSGVDALNTLAASKLSSFDLDLTAYDEAFFAENRLVLIPRTSASGSVTYQARLSVDESNLHIELDVQTPQAGTDVMSQWLVLVAVPNGEYDDMSITVPEAGGNPGHVTK